MSWNPIAQGSSVINVKEVAMAFPAGHLANARIEYVGAASVMLATPLHACTARVMHNSSADVGVDVTISTDLTVSFGNPNGIGGLDTGTEAADAYYEVWLGAKAAGADPGLMFVKVGTSGTWPAGYDYRMLLVTVQNSSGDIVSFPPIVSQPYMQQ